MSQLIRFEKIVPEGKAMGRLEDGRAVFSVGPLPNEIARVGIRKQKRTFAEAELREIVEPSPKRTTVAEDHALICSPWQGVDYAYQCELKALMLAESMAQHHVVTPTAKVELVPSPKQTAYRNRLDFTVARIEDQFQLAFHQRGSWDTLIPLLAGCKLGTPKMNQAALDLVRQLNELEFDVLPAVITVREAGTTGELMTILTTTAKRQWARVNTKHLGNFVVARPVGGSGAPGPRVYRHGQTFITEQIDGVELSYPYDAFFQVNTPVFELALQQIIAGASKSRRVIELYSGVGAIGLPLAKQGIDVQGVEIIHSAVEYAEKNARANSLNGYHAEAMAAEQIDASVLSGGDCIVVDPPRAGLHPRVRQWIEAAKPNTLIYLSCNPATQARDMALMQDSYKLKALTGYDFYPGTLHLESLAILERT